jgi:hypothetical protein
MNFKEQIESLPQKEGLDIVDEKLLRQTKITGAAGMTWEELYNQASNDNELESNEDFFTFVRRIKKSQEDNDQNPENPIRNAA